MVIPGIAISGGNTPALCHYSGGLATARVVGRTMDDRPAYIAAVARRKLRQIEIAGRLDDLRVPPGNRVEVLKGNRAGQ